MPLLMDTKHSSCREGSKSCGHACVWNALLMWVLLYLHVVTQIHPELMQVLLTPQPPLSINPGTGFHEPAHPLIDAQPVGKQWNY